MFIKFRSHLTHGRVPGTRERGSVTLENIIIYPAVMIFIFGFFQFALWLHAKDLAHGAATAAYYESRVLNGTAAQGQAAGQNLIDGAGGTINGSTVTVTRTATTVVATVTGSTTMMIPGWPGSSLSETVTGPIERFVAP